MNNTLSATPANPYMASLEEAIQRADSPVRVIVLADKNSDGNDCGSAPSLSEAISETLADTSVAVLEVPRDKWNLQDKNLVEAIDWAFERGTIQKIVLAGSSKNHDSTGDGSSLPELEEIKTGAMFQRLLAGVQQTGKQIREAQQDFASQVQQLTKQNFVRNDESAVDVSGLFYREEDGLFLSYDPQQSCFRPLTLV